jgi:class 3 adenylate cyclase
MKCPRCERETPSDADFCPECGAKLAAVCGSCGTANAASHKFCKKCGHQLGADTGAGQRSELFTSPESYTPKHLAEKIRTSKAALEGERKQVTVLFADVVGFSTLSARCDPEAVHTIMDGCFELLTRDVHRYEGTINQFTGDGIMALFGAPITHEDHAIRALQAALAIQTDVAGYGDAVQRRFGLPFQLRIGVNTGTVVVGRIGDNLRMDYTAQGDTTNLAARLQQMAPPGAIWVGDPLLPHRQWDLRVAPGRADPGQGARHPGADARAGRPPARPEPLRAPGPARPHALRRARPRVPAAPRLLDPGHSEPGTGRLRGGRGRPRQEPADP